jgi:hypothetical protein
MVSLIEAKRGVGIFYITHGPLPYYPKNINKIIPWYAYCLIYLCFKVLKKELADRQAVHGKAAQTSLPYQNHMQKHLQGETMKKRFVVGLVAGLAMLAIFGAANASTYQIVYADPSTDWTSARVQAQNLGDGWDLACITSQAEFDTVAGLLKDGTKDREELWIGASRAFANVDSPFEWISGETWDYTNWHAGEPNGDGLGLVMDWRNGIGWKWNDEGSIAVVGFVAENNTVPVPAAFWLLGSGLIGLIGLKRKKI